MLSHLGSGAVIMQRHLEDTLAGQATPDDYAPRVWNTWNAKAPAAQRDDALAADTALLARIEAVTPASGSTFIFAHGTDDLRVRRVRRAAPQRARLPHLGH